MPRGRKSEDLRPPCKFNEGVSCDEDTMNDKWMCRNCGWNPEEIRRRNAEIITAQIPETYDTMDDDDFHVIDFVW